MNQRRTRKVAQQVSPRKGNGGRRKGRVVIKEVVTQRPRARPRRKNRNTNTIAGGLWKGAGWLLNKGLGALVSGFGDYKVASNSLMSGGLDPPTIVNSSNSGGVIVRHREYLQDISATTTFHIESFNLNPGLLSSFPWLSGVAQHFEQYKFRGLIFEFKSLSSDAVLSSATSSALGSVVMATQYDVLDDQFPDKFTMENYQFANSAKPSLSFIHPVECAKSETSISELYVRSDVTPSNSDLRLYDLGKFNIATVGMQASSGIAGELWCTYEVELYKPKIPEESETSRADHFKLIAGNTGLTPFAFNTVAPNNSLHGSLANNKYTFPDDLTEGHFLLLWYEFGTSAVLASAPSPIYTNCAALPMLGSTSTVATLSSGGTSAILMVMTFVNITAANATVDYTGTTLPTAMVNGDFFAIQIPSGLTHTQNPAELTICNEPETQHIDVDDLILKLQKMGLIPYRK